MERRMWSVVVVAIVCLLLAGCPNLFGIVSLVGDWALEYRWSTMIAPHTAGLTFHPGGTFSVEGEGLMGTWVQDGRNISFFDTLGATWTGTIRGRRATGTMETTSGTYMHGTFRMDKE